MRGIDWWLVDSWVMWCWRCDTRPAAEWGSIRLMPKNKKMHYYQPIPMWLQVYSVPLHTSTSLVNQPIYFCFLFQPSGHFLYCRVLFVNFIWDLCAVNNYWYVNFFFSVKLHLFSALLPWNNFALVNKTLIQLWLMRDNWALWFLK